MTSSRPIAILGAGGFAREVLDIFEAQQDAGARIEVAGFLVDEGMGSPGTLIHDRPILGTLEWLGGRSRSVDLICAIGAPEIRRDVVLRASDYGAGWASAVHPSVIMSRRIELGSGIVVAAGTIMTNHIRVGNHVHLNLDCTVGHDAVLEDFATVAPGVHISGRVTLAEGAYVGTGVSVIERCSIGPWSVVGAGAVVTTDIPANATAVGVPARVIKTRESGWHRRS